MTQETTGYAKPHDVQHDAQGEPIEVAGPSGIGYVYDDDPRSTYKRFHAYYRQDGIVVTTRPACQSFGSYSQCQNPGAYLEAPGHVIHDGTIYGDSMKRPAAPDAPRFYYCGIHAPSRIAARKRKKQAQIHADNAQRDLRRQAEQAAHDQLEAWFDGLSARGEAIEAAREKIIEAVRDAGRFPNLIDALDAAIAERAEWKEQRP